MILKRENKIVRSNIKNSIIIKFIFLNIIFKSIFHNRNIKNFKRMYALMNLKKKQKNSKLNDFCLITGQSKGLNKQLSISRHKMNILLKQGLINNFKIKSW